MIIAAFFAVLVIGYTLLSASPATNTSDNAGFALTTDSDISNATVDKPQPNSGSASSGMTVSSEFLTQSEPSDDADNPRSSTTDNPFRRTNIIGNKDVERLSKTGLLGIDSDQIEMDLPSDNAAFASDSAPTGDALAKTFLEVAYRQAVENGDPIAEQIQQELQQFDQDNREQPLEQNQAEEQDEQAQEQLDVCEGDELECLCAKYPGFGDCQSLKEEIEETPAHCFNRPAAAAGTFRCPCPGDVDWRPNWKDYYSPELLQTSGCF